MKKINPCYVGLFFVILICIALGYACAHANAEERVEWTLLRGELSGEEPDKVKVESLAAAMSMAILNHREQTLPIFQTAMIIACNHKDRPKRAAVFILYSACLTVPELTEIFVNTARQICPQSGAADKVVLPAKEIEEDLSAPFNFGGLTPPPDIFTPVTPVKDGKR